MFSFESLDVYQLSLEFAKEIVKTTFYMPRGYFSLVDQLRRASTSISLNIAEGSGRYAKGEKRQFYSIAKGSTYECVPLVSLFKDLGLFSSEQTDNFKETLQRIAKMLTKLVQSVS